MNNPIDERQDRAEETRSPSFMRLFGQMMMLPFTVFVQGMELFIKTMQGMQRATDKGMNVMVGEATQAPERLGSQGELASDATTRVGTDATTEADADTTQKERRIMDKDLRDDMLKLVRYKVLFVKREYEHAFPEREDLVSDNMDGSAFTAWKAAEFIQELKRGETGVPTKWKDKGYPKDEHRHNGNLTGLPDEDKKYLRVFYEVLERYPREKFKYEEQQIRVLEEIRDKMPQKH
jgi:hypothetical protein